MELERRKTSLLRSCLQHGNKHPFVYSGTIQEIFLSSLPLLVRHTEAVFKLVDLEAFPASGIWACPTLTSSHIAAKLEHELSFLPHPAASYPYSGPRPSFLPVPFSFLLSPQVLLIDGRETWAWGQMGARPRNSWSAWFGWSGDQGTL